MATIPKGYMNTGRYSWTKKNAEARAARAKKKYGFNLKVIKTTTSISKRPGYVIVGKVSRGKAVISKRR